MASDEESSNKCQRSSLRKSVSLVAGLMILLYFFTALYVLLLGVQNEKHPEHETASDYAEDGGLSVDVVHPKMPSVRIIGVSHTPVAYSVHGHVVEEAIRSSDGVLLEYGEEGYFRNLMEFSEHEGKETAFVDGLNFLSRTFLIAGPIVTCFFLGIALILRFRKNSWRRIGALAAVGAALSAMGLPSSVEVIAHLSGMSRDASLRALEISYAVDGRTVLMMDSAARISAALPGRRLVLVCGAAHARAMLRYMDSGVPPIKSALYRRVYRLFETDRTVSEVRS